MNLFNSQGFHSKQELSLEQLVLQMARMELHRRRKPFWLVQKPDQREEAQSDPRNDPEVT